MRWRCVSGGGLGLVFFFSLFAAGCLQKKSTFCATSDDCTPGTTCDPKSKTCMGPDGGVGGSGGSGGGDGSSPDLPAMVDGSSPDVPADGSQPDAPGSDGGSPDLNVDAIPSCADGATCPSSAPNCDPKSHGCFSCKVAPELCPTGRTNCEPTSGRCVACAQDNQCGDGGACDPRADAATQFTCVSCYKSATPAADGGTDAGTPAPGQCGPDRPICEDRSAQPTVNTCVQCRAKADCSGRPTRPDCDTATSTCVCTTDASCPAATPICDQTMKACTKCTTDEACSAKSAAAPASPAAPACLLAGTTAGTCVACTNSAKHCGIDKATPICGSDNNCHACTRDKECADAYGADPGVCLGGRCLTNDDVIYVKAGGQCTQGTGSLATPFCELASAAQVIAPMKRTIVVRGPDLVKSEAAFAFNGGAVTVVGQKMAALSVVSAATTALVSLTAGDLTLRDLVLTGVTSATGAAVVATGGTLHMNRCQVLGNNSGITVGGASFDITNTIVAGNTGPTAVSLGAFTASGPKTFSFNTVAANAAIGVFCATGTSYSITNSVIAGNGAASVSGCVFTDTCSMGCSSNPMLSTTYHLQSSVSSACVDKVTSGYPADDVDGDTRPQGASADCGADELAR